MIFIFDKTEKGREEIATRKYNLAPRLRTLLLLIDGKKSTEDILKKVAGLGLGGKSIAELRDSDFIYGTEVKEAAPAKEAKAAKPKPSSKPAAVSDERRGSGLPASDKAELPRDKPVPLKVLRGNEDQFQAIYNFYTVTIKETIGLRGYALQMKVERANTITDFRDLRRPYLEAVFKSKGEALTRTLRDRLDQLLFRGEMPPPQSKLMVHDAEQ